MVLLDMVSDDLGRAPQDGRRVEERIPPQDLDAVELLVRRREARRPAALASHRLVKLERHAHALDAFGDGSELAPMPEIAPLEEDQRVATLQQLEHVETFRALRLGSVDKDSLALEREEVLRPTIVSVANSHPVNFAGFLRFRNMARIICFSKRP